MPIPLDPAIHEYREDALWAANTNLYDIRYHIARHGEGSVYFLLSRLTHDHPAITGVQVCDGSDDSSEANSSILHTLSTDWLPYSLARHHLVLGTDWNLSHCQGIWDAPPAWGCICGGHINKTNEEYVTVEVVCENGFENRCNEMDASYVEEWWSEYDLGYHDDELAYHYHAYGDPDECVTPLVLPEHLFYYQNIHLHCLPRFMAMATGGEFRQNWHSDALRRQRVLDVVPAQYCTFSTAPTIF